MESTREKEGQLNHSSPDDGISCHVNWLQVMAVAVNKREKNSPNVRGFFFLGLLALLL